MRSLPKALHPRGTRPKRGEDSSRPRAGEEPKLPTPLTWWGRPQACLARIRVKPPRHGSNPSRAMFFPCPSIRSFVERILPHRTTSRNVSLCRGSLSRCSRFSFYGTNDRITNILTNLRQTNRP